jgi:hypothetical protein
MNSDVKSFWNLSIQGLFRRPPNPPESMITTVELVSSELIDKECH